MTQLSDFEPFGLIYSRVGSFDDIPLPDNSCDLVSSFLAAHWFDPLEKFYSEAKRVLKPGGCLVVGGYGLPSVHYGDGRLNDELHVIYTEVRTNINNLIIRSS